jgi:hypothetical protein
VKVRVYQPCRECNGDGYDNANERREVSFAEIKVFAAHYQSLIQSHKDEIQRIRQYLDNLPKPLPKPSAGTCVYRNLDPNRRDVPQLPTVDALLDVAPALPAPSPADIVNVGSLYSIYRG